jgi:hypothetical protein
MSVYRVAVPKASCRVSGCACHDRVPRYPSDMTDAEWELLRPEAEAVMAELRRSPAGRPMEHDLRAVLDAIGYMTRYGIEWRALPVDFPSFLWNLICHPCLPWFTETIGSRVAVAGTPISRGVAPAGVGMSTSCSRSLSRAFWP